MRHIKQMEDIFTSLKEMEWDGIIPEEDIIARCGKNYPWWNNGFDEMQSKNKPEGYLKGRLPRDWKSMGAKASKGKKWYNNGSVEKLCFTNPPGWKKGRLIKSLKNFKAKKGSGCGQKPGTYKIIFNNGVEIIIVGLEPWCIKNGYTPTCVRDIMTGRRKKSYYKDIVAVEKLNTTP